MEELGLTEVLPPALHPLLDYISAEAAVAIAVIMSFLKEFWKNLKDELAKKVSIAVAFVVVGGMKAYEFGMLDQLSAVAEVGIEWILAWFASAKIGYGGWKKLRRKKESDDTADVTGGTATSSESEAVATTTAGDGDTASDQHPDPVPEGGGSSDPVVDSSGIIRSGGGSSPRFGHQPAG